MQTNLTKEVSKVKFAARKLSIITHPTRIQIIELLLEKNQLNVTHIYETLKLTQVEASLHLALMKNYGILSRERLGKMNFYSVNTDTLDKLLQFANEQKKKINR
jgi:DNA-binding transcriptional ArsR family regulator